MDGWCVRKEHGFGVRKARRGKACVRYLARLVAFVSGMAGWQGEPALSTYRSHADNVVEIYINYFYFQLP